MKDARQTAKSSSQVLNRKPEANSLLAPSPCPVDAAGHAAQDWLPPVQARFGHDFSRLTSPATGNLSLDTANSYAGDSHSAQSQEYKSHAIVPDVVQRINLKTTNTAPKNQKNNADFSNRPSEPHREVELEKTVFKGEDVPQSRHHIIPWNTLSAFIRLAYDKGHGFAVSGVLEPAVTTMMANSPRYIRGKRGAVPVNEEGGERMQGEATEQDLKDEINKDRRDAENGEKNSANVSAISTAYCWMPGNLFLGPLNTLRLDDPDEDFEYNAKDQVGSDFEKYKLAFENIKAYLATPTAKLARDISDFLKTVASKTTPFPFLEDKWESEQDAKGGRRYRLKAS